MYIVILPPGPPGQFSCNVTCPAMPFVSGLSDTCIVQWTRPQTQTASCAPPIMGYTVAITTINPSMDVSASTFAHETTALEPFMFYTASITASDELGMTSTCSVVFITSKEDRKYNFIIILAQIMLIMIIWLVHFLLQVQ